MKRILFSLCIATLAVRLPAPAAANDVPFVSAWDRFGRHGEISEELSSALLISELSCAACHQSTNPAHQPKLGPRLDETGTRLQKDWVREYLLNPSEHRPGTTMPDVLAGYPTAEKASAVEALTAFLMSQQKPLFEIKGNGINPVPLEFWKHGDPQRGRELYHTSGCVACHAADEDYEVSEMKLSEADRRLDQLDAEDLADLGLEAAARRVNSVPHPVFHRKYSVKSLTWFLMNPEAVRPSGRMPNPGIRAVDAADLAAFLMNKSDAGAIERQAPPEPADRQSAVELVRRGAQLFQQTGCANCHAAPASSNLRLQSLQAVAGIWNSNMSRPSCVSSPRRGMPDYSLSEAQQGQLVRALKTVNQRLTRERALQLTMLQLNCYACHQRDDSGGVGRYRRAYFETAGQVDIGDEGRLPPPLTGVGARLTTKWLKDVFSGKSQLRPFMTIRMPRYPNAEVKDLPAQFAVVDHANAFPSEQQVFGNFTGLEESGRQLMDAGCVQCHVFNGESLPGTVGVDLSGVTERVHADWLHAFLLNPGSMKKGTRMPTFFPGGQSQNSTILDGNTSKQVSAIYAYLKKIDQLPLPQKIADVRNQDFELRPTDQPIVFRTFMPIAGTHAIAIGYPEKVHVAFDAENLFFAEAWRGRFLDAQGTWFVRSAPPASPLGADRVTLPPGPGFARLTSVTSSWPAKLADGEGRFDGYSLDNRGMPVLKYHFGTVAISDRIDPQENGTLMRTVTVAPTSAAGGTAEGRSLSSGTLSSGTLWLKAHEGKRLDRVSVGEFTDEQGLKIKVTGLDLSEGKVVRQGATTRWLLPVPVESGQPIRIEYRW